MMSAIWQDIRFGFRMLMKYPVFSIVVVLTLALGIGVNTSVFSLFNAIVLRPLPVKDAHQIVNLYLKNKNEPRFMSLSYPDFRDISEQNEVFAGTFASTWSSAIFSREGEVSENPETVSGMVVNADYFKVLGINPAFGRGFLPDEDKVADLGAVVVLHHDYWTKEFQGDPTILGKTIYLNHSPFTIIGIMPESFDGVEMTKPDYWTLLSMLSVFRPGHNSYEERHNHFLQVKARLKPEIDIKQAQSAIAVLAERIWVDIPDFNNDMTIALTHGSFLNPKMRQEVLPIAMLVMAAVGLILFIACANVANLMLARALERQKEIAVRLALGVRRWQLIRQLLTESSVLAVIGGVVGLVITYWFSEVLLALMQSTSRNFLTLNVTPDSRVFVYTAVLSFCSAILFGLFPAWQSSKTNLSPVLKDESVVFGKSFHRSWLRNGLAVLQIALSMVLLTGSGLLTRALYQAQTLNPGFEVDHTGFVGMDMRLWNYDKLQAQEFHRTLSERIKTIAGVEAVTLATFVPLSQSNSVSPIRKDEANANQTQSNLNVNVNYVALNFFQTLKIPILRGREFLTEDISDIPRTAVISKALATQLWGDDDPVGKQFQFGVSFGSGELPFITVVGVAQDCRNISLTNTDPMFLYLPMTPSSFVDAQLLFRSSGAPQMALSTIYGLIRNMDSRLVPKGNTMTYNIADFVAESRASMMLSIILGSLALILALTGVYGVLSFNVSQQTRETGIRMALGAYGFDVIRNILWNGMGLVFTGLAIGLAGAILASNLLKNELYGISTLDSLAYGTAILLLTLSSLLACYIPARRAANVDPMTALRCE